MRELRAKYAWADEDDDLAWTVGVFDRFAADAILAFYGARSGDQLGDMTFDDAMALRNEHFDEYAVVQIKTHQKYGVAIEPNGWTGNMPEIARRASASGGHFFSIYWSPSAFQILEAKDGQATASFDPNFIGLPAGANDLLPGWVDADAFPLEQLKASCLAAMQQRTRLAFDRSWLAARLPTYRIPDPDKLLKEVEGARMGMMGAVPQPAARTCLLALTSATNPSSPPSVAPNTTPIHHVHAAFGLHGAGHHATMTTTASPPHSTATP